MMCFFRGMDRDRIVVCGSSFCFFCQRFRFPKRRPVSINGVHPLLGENISIRVNGVDTPEMKTKNKCEKEMAQKAQRYVASVMATAKRVDLKNIKRGKYFRVVADVEVDGQ